ncbi:hypothetical protein ACFL08_03880 [Patescibacteria group bacterium]
MSCLILATLVQVFKTTIINSYSWVVLFDNILIIAIFNLVVLVFTVVILSVQYAYRYLPEAEKKFNTINERLGRLMVLDALNDDEILETITHEASWEGIIIAARDVDISYIRSSLNDEISIISKELSEFSYPKEPWSYKVCEKLFGWMV